MNDHRTVPKLDISVSCSFHRFGRPAIWCVVGVEPYGHLYRKREAFDDMAIWCCER
jgi:hypothetical protein